MEADFNSILGSISADVLTATAGALALSSVSYTHLTLPTNGLV